MRNTVVIASAAFGFMAGAWAQPADEDHSAHHAAPPSGSAAAPAAVASDGGIRNDMKHVQDLMARVRQTVDPERRRALLAEHLNALREQVRAMRAASARPPMAMMSQDGPREERSQASGDTIHAAHEHNVAEGTGDTPKRGMMGGGMMMKMHRRVEQRLDAIEQLLEQLVEREIAESGLR